MADDTTAMTVRLPADLAQDLAVIAECDGEPVAEAVRAAVANWVSMRRLDPLVQAALRRRIEHTTRLLAQEVSDGS